MFEELSEQDQIDLIAVFWVYVNKKGPVPAKTTGIKTACWLWEGNLSPEGYPRFTCYGTRYFSRRIGYFLKTGKDPKDLIVSCLCGNNVCVRHLTAQSRSALRASQNRSNKGNGFKPNAKLDENDVRNIRRLAKEGVQWKHRQDAFKVSRTTISNVVSGRVWGHVK